MENKIKNLEMIQNIIQRMSNNSFLLKGWTISLIVAVFVLTDKTMDQMYFLIAYVPVVVFWFLDSYYLQLERKYVTLYDNVREKREIDFDLKIDNITYETTNKFKLRYCNCLFSRSEVLFYLPILVMLTIIFRDELNIILKA